MKSNKNFRIFLRLMKAQTFNYITDPINIILGVVLTTVTMLCWVAFKPHDAESGLLADSFVLASAIGISSIRNSQYNLNLTLADWRETRFIRNLLTTPVSKRILYSSILCFNWIVNILVTLLLISLAMLFSSQRQVISDVEWGPFLLGFVLNILLSNVIALFLSTTFKNKEYVFIISLLSYFGPMYLLGLGIPWNVVGQIPVINILTYIAPHRYTLHLMQAAWVGNASNMAFPGVEASSWLGQHGFGYGGNGWWLPAVISISFIILFALAFYMRLKNNYQFGIRKYSKFKGIKKHTNNIELIKKTSSIDELKALVEIAGLNYKEEKTKKRNKIKTIKPSKKRGGK
ncbi:hypothetical protein CG007_01020 [Mesoplasma entomophilum]|uniref:ABC transporter permease n=1 Tax=Mesoplasma coleopterae TaxID=324078 RepID=A0A2K8P1S5_9MOLU|nr:MULTISPECIES: hypothetical protein [Mesoplasma]ATZ20714.1 ABC transporter permease [Mesoplasma coleopterae]AVN60202.1 hypothetical protein CG007_01020 [Mesoplasma entomophilum]AVN62226.1 hypothetical protein CG001_00985 [Mesoplasma coleopterae]AVN62894.1 hypothetical protein CG000_01055 [Mesoplasma coleopterae]